LHLSTTTTTKTEVPKGLDTRVLARVLEEGYGPGAWHGPDLKAALADVEPGLAFWPPSPERHNIAEIALHHAYTARSVRARLTGTEPEAFVLEGDDWFALSDPKRLAWPRVLEVLEAEQGRLAQAVADAGAGRVKSPLTEAERFELVLGITCHAVYHAGQVQLIKKLRRA
jgi:hypothetical protein